MRILDNKWVWRIAWVLLTLFYFYVVFVMNARPN